MFDAHARIPPYRNAFRLVLVFADGLRQAIEHPTIRRDGCRLIETRFNADVIAEAARKFWHYLEQYRHLFTVDCPEGGRDAVTSGWDDAVFESFAVFVFYNHSDRRPPLDVHPEIFAKLNGVDIDEQPDWVVEWIER